MLWSVPCTVALYMLTPSGGAVRFLPLFHFFCSLFFLPNFNFYLFSCTCLRQLAQEPHFSVRRQFSQTLHLANISDQSCQLTFEITSKTNTKHVYRNSKYVTTAFFKCTFFRTQKTKWTLNRQGRTATTAYIWTTLYLVVSILGLRTNISSWGINFKTIIGKVNMQKKGKTRKRAKLMLTSQSLIVDPAPSLIPRNHPSDAQER